jgi:hypothetical protein
MFQEEGIARLGVGKKREAAYSGGYTSKSLYIVRLVEQTRQTPKTGRGRRNPCKCLHGLI